jgi:hypothetical protein
MRADFEQRLACADPAGDGETLLDRRPDSRIHACQDLRVLREQLAADAARLHQRIRALLVFGNHATQRAGIRAGFF